MDIGCNFDIGCGVLNLYDDRELVLIKLNEAIDFLHKKWVKGNYQNKENKKI